MSLPTKHIKDNNIFHMFGAVHCPLPALCTILQKHITITLTFCNLYDALCLSHTQVVGNGELQLTFLHI